MHRLMCLQGPLLRVLPQLLQHRLTRLDVRTICHLLQVSKRLRAALQTVGRGSVVVAELSPAPSAQAGFATWLPGHAGLVGRIDTGPAVGTESDKVLVQGLYTLSLQQAAAAMPPLSLCEFATSIPCASIISALPAGSLTSLHLRFPGMEPQVLAAPFTSSIAALPNLREFLLLFEPCEGVREVTDACLAGLSQLPLLTSVYLYDCSWTSLGGLPSQLLNLRLTTSSDQDDVLVDISHLSRLEYLDIDTEDLTAGSGFPSGLLHLIVRKCPLVAENVSHLTSLEQLELRPITGCEDPSLLQCLSRLPNLQHVSLTYPGNYFFGGWEAAVAAAPTWKQLTQLKAFSLTASEADEDYEEEEFKRDLQIITKGLAAARSLTSLVLCSMPVADLCYHVGSLRGLLMLGLYDCSFLRSDAFHLTVLSGLKSLAFRSCTSVDEAVVVALASNLTDLQALELQDCGMVSSDAPLPALRGLQGLRSLSLVGCKGLRDESCELLAQLTQLQDLQLVATGEEQRLSEARVASLRQAFGDGLHIEQQE